MSYTSPKYTYVSQQPAFDKLQKDIVGAAADIAKKKQDHIDAERKKGEEIDALGRSASQSYIIDKAGYNDVGNQVTKGAVGELFAGTGKRVGEITRLTSGANPQCKIDGNCNELYEELAALKEFWENKDLNIVFISAANNVNIRNLKKELFSKVKDIHYTRFPYNKTQIYY